MRYEPCCAGKQAEEFLLGQLRAGQPGVTPYDWWEYDMVKNVSKDKTAWESQLPVALVERIAKVSINEGDLVLDPFMGSGTTALAGQAINDG